MFLYLSNPATMNWSFQYRLKSREQWIPAEIPRETQVKLQTDFVGKDEQDYIIAQLERYGALPYNDVRAIVYPNSLLYRWGEPIPVGPQDEALLKDQAIRDAMAAEMIEATGASNMAAMEQTLKEHNVNPDNLRATTLEIVETVEAGGAKKGGTDIEITVDKDAHVPGGIDRTTSGRGRGGKRTKA